MVKAAPNQSVVIALISGVEKTHQSNIFSVKLKILSSNSVKGYHNFLGNEAKTIEATIQSTKKLEPSEIPVRIILRYQGDEHGGTYYGSID